MDGHALPQPGLFDVKGRTALVTGSTRGLGRTTIDWLATLDDAAWDENLLHAADALAADDRAIITKLQSS